MSRQNAFKGLLCCPIIWLFLSFIDGFVIVNFENSYARAQKLSCWNKVLEKALNGSEIDYALTVFIQLFVVFAQASGTA